MLTLDNVKLAVIGLGYVGLPLAVEFGKKRSIVGFDINVPRINALKAGKDKSDARSVIKVHTTETEPGHNVGVSRVPGYITAVMTLYEAAAPDNVLGEVEIERAPAQGATGFDFDTGGRLAEGYAKIGKEFGTWLTKKDWGRKH